MFKKYEHVLPVESIQLIQQEAEDVISMSIKGAVKEKLRGYMTPENLRSWTIPIRHESDVPVSRNWYKTVSKLYQNAYI